MKMSFGKYKDKAVGWVLVEHIDYFLWMHRKGMTNWKEYSEFLRLCSILDEKPFIRPCMGHCKPKNTATRFSIYTTNPSPYYYCDECDPYESGAIRGKLSFGRTISDAISISADPNSTVKAIALSKGLPKRKTESALNEFFS